MWYYYDSHTTFHNNPNDSNWTARSGGSTGDEVKCKGLIGASLTSSNYCSSEPGATVEGNNSYQSFRLDDLDVENYPSAVLELQMVGVGKTESTRDDKRYCTSCGKEVHRKDRYCGRCGRRV